MPSGIIAYFLSGKGEENNDDGSHKMIINVSKYYLCYIPQTVIIIVFLTISLLFQSLYSWFPSWCSLMYILHFII